MYKIAAISFCISLYTTGCGSFETNKKLYPWMTYGEYGGPGNAYGQKLNLTDVQPLQAHDDPLDKLFELHDALYDEAKTKSDMLKADKELVRAIDDIIPKLDTESQKFAKKAKLFFNSGLHYVLHANMLFDGEHNSKFSRSEIEDYMSLQTD